MVYISIINYALQLQFLQNPAVVGFLQVLTCSERRIHIGIIYSNSKILAGIRTHDLHGTSLKRYQWSCPDWIIDHLVKWNMKFLFKHAKKW